MSVQTFSVDAGSPDVGLSRIQRIVLPVDEKYRGTGEPVVGGKDMN
jgi:hypothetical protein